jgi:hypothetical protein
MFIELPTTPIAGTLPPGITVLFPVVPGLNVPVRNVIVADGPAPLGEGTAYLSLLVLIIFQSVQT